MKNKDVFNIKGNLIINTKVLLIHSGFAVKIV